MDDEINKKRPGFKSHLYHLLAMYQCVFVSDKGTPYMKHCEKLKCCTCLKDLIFLMGKGTVTFSGGQVFLTLSTLTLAGTWADCSDCPGLGCPLCKVRRACVSFPQRPGPGLSGHRATHLWGGSYLVAVGSRPPRPLSPTPHQLIWPCWSLQIYGRRPHPPLSQRTLLSHSERKPLGLFREHQDPFQF